MPWKLIKPAYYATTKTTKCSPKAHKELGTDLYANYITNRTQAAKRDNETSGFHHRSHNLASFLLLPHFSHLFYSRLHLLYCLGYLLDFDSNNSQATRRGLSYTPMRTHRQNRPWTPDRRLLVH